MHGLVRCKHEHRCSHARGVDVSFRDVTIKIPDRGCEWRHAPEACMEDFGDLRKVRVEFLPRKKTVDFWGSPRPCGGCRKWWWWGGGADGKVSIERFCISLPHIEKPFNAKVIKSFIPELRSRKVFRVSGFLCYLSMSYEHSMYISHISISWLCYSLFIIFSCTFQVFLLFFLSGSIIFNKTCLNIYNAANNLEQVLAATNPQDTNCTANCLLSRKLFKLDEPEMQDTAGEAGTNS